ncbi:MAG: hypothetical protein K5898_06915 [Ruminococcus sp.]|uniref:hypothetical protein n=1 Tax=Ruminococcus sp. TaxID=41978 RepID=UPI0025F45FC1|nr:hypothetical protein [Ruminococcus sp.]MCR4794884.1 hypothetical protein [Ruminococcus sp.]
MKKIIDKVNKLSLSVKIQLVIAILCTMAIPVYAWFAYQDRIEALSKVKEPPSINLASGGEDPALYISLENLDVNTTNHEKYVVFSVEPGKYSAYDIQLTHTTNIPFTYELYRVRQDNENGTIEYTDHSIDVNGGETELKYSIMTTAAGTTNGKVTLTDINQNDDSPNRILGAENKLETYDRRNYNTGTDEVNQYVEPIYSVARRIPQLSVGDDGSSDRDYYAIKITWQVNPNIGVDDADYWNYAFNNKETDIIYISAKQNTYQETNAEP